MRWSAVVNSDDCGARLGDRRISESSLSSKRSRRCVRGTVASADRWASVPLPDKGTHASVSNDAHLRRHEGRTRSVRAARLARRQHHGRRPPRRVRRSLGIETFRPPAPDALTERSGASAHRSLSETDSHPGSRSLFAQGERRDLESRPPGSKALRLFASRAQPLCACLLGCGERAKRAGFGLAD